MNADTTSKCAYLFSFLKKSGVKSIDVGFYGHGDDGQTEWQGVEWLDNFTEPEEFWDQPSIFCWGGGMSGGNDKGNISLAELVDQIVDGVMEFYDIDYMNDQGNTGNIIFNIETGKITTTYQVTETKREDLYI